MVVIIRIYVVLLARCTVLFPVGVFVRSCSCCGCCGPLTSVCVCVFLDVVCVFNVFRFPSLTVGLGDLGGSLFPLQCSSFFCGPPRQVISASWCALACHLPYRVTDPGVFRVAFSVDLHAVAAFGVCVGLSRLHPGPWQVRRGW